MTGIDTYWGMTTGATWFPLIFLLIFIVILAALILWGRVSFRRDFNTRSGQEKPFNSGNVEEIDYSIQSSNMFWGFRKALDWYYGIVAPAHNGDVNDYLKWLVITMAVCLLLIGGGLL